MSGRDETNEVEEQARGVHHDNPNQEVVRPDGSGPGMPEGQGGSTIEPTPTPIEADSGEQETEETPARKPRAGARKRDDDDD